MINIFYNLIQFFILKKGVIFTQTKKKFHVLLFYICCSRNHLRVIKHPLEVLEILIS